MKTQFGSCSTIKRAVLFLLFVAIVTAPLAAQTRQFTIKNNCSETVWLAGAGTPTPVFNGSSGGLQMLPGASVVTTVQSRGPRAGFGDAGTAPSTAVAKDRAKPEIAAACCNARTPARGTPR